MESFQLIVGMANLRKEISTIATSAAKLNERIHVCAVSCLAHVRDHGDWTPAALLCDALPKGQRVKALVYWFSHFSNGKLKLRETELGYRATLAKDRTAADLDRKSTRLNSSHVKNSYAVFCLKKKNTL